MKTLRRVLVPLQELMVKFVRTIVLSVVLVLVVHPQFPTTLASVVPTLV